MQLIFSGNIMFLCSLDGKLYNDEAIYQEINLIQDIFKEPKEMSCKVCCICYSLINTKYKQNHENKYLIPKDDKIKVYKISSNNFGYKEKKELDESSKDLIKILDNCKKDIKKKTEKK